MEKDELEKKIDEKKVLQKALKKILDNSSEEELLKYKNYYKLKKRKNEKN